MHQSSDLLRTTFILLRKTPFQDSGFIVSGISPQYGRIDFVFRGARSISKKKFPMIGLFRVYSIEFRIPNFQNGQMVYVSSMELQLAHDGIASRVQAYLRACKLSAFLLRHIPTMCEIPVIFEAFSALLAGLESASLPTELSSALFLFIYAREQGVFPQNIFPSQQLEDAFCTCALNPLLPLPIDLPSDLLPRLRNWADSAENIL